MPDPTANYASDDVVQSFRPGQPSGTDDLENQIDATNQLAATAQPSQPSYPPSPDQGGPVPDVSANDAPQAPQPFWRSVLLGALGGLANRLKGAGEGFATHGVMGAVAGAVDPDRAEQLYANAGRVNQARADVAQATAQSAQQNVRIAGENHDLAMAVAQIHLHELEQHDAGLLSGEDRAALLKDAAVAGQQLRDNGVAPVFTGDEEDADAHLSARMGVNQNNPVGVVKLPNADGSFSVFEIPNNSKPYDHPVTLTIGYNDGPDGDGQPITKLYGSGEISIAQGLAIEAAAWADHMRFLRGESTAAQKADAAETLQGMKGQTSVDVAKIKAAAMAGTASAGDVARQLLLGNMTPADITSRNNLRANAIALADQMSKQAGGQGYSAIVSENSAAAAKATEKAFTSGSQGQQLTAIATARQHMAVFKQTAQALDNGDAVFANHLAQSLGLQFGSDAASNFSIAREAFAGEVGKALAGANVGVSDRNELREKVTHASSPKQLVGFADTADDLLKGKQIELQKSYESGMKGQPNFGAAAPKPASANPYLKGGR
jgi:hypothetical protein